MTLDKIGESHNFPVHHHKDYIVQYQSKLYVNDFSTSFNIISLNILIQYFKW